MQYHWIIIDPYMIALMAECKPSFCAFFFYLCIDKRKDLIPPKELCPQSLTLVNSTKEENHIEGTLQLLSDMLQPGYYPPRNIIVHVLHDILLEPNCPNHLCVQAFQLLIRTQRWCIHTKDAVAPPLRSTFTLHLEAFCLGFWTLICFLQAPSSWYKHGSLGLEFVDLGHDWRGKNKWKCVLNILKVF